MSKKKEVLDSSDTGKAKDSLDVAKATIQKKYGKVLQTMADKGELKIQTVSSGSIGLDVALGRGGLARGRVYEIYGPPMGGKTTLTMSILAQAQKKGLKCCFVDAEHSADPMLFKSMGVDLSVLDLLEAYNGEDNLDALEILLKSRSIDVVVVDSVAALIPKAEAEASIDDDFMALLARLMSKALRRFVPIVSETNTLLIFINQIRHNLKKWGRGEVTTGGEALNFYSTGRIEVSGGEYQSSRIIKPTTGEVIGHMSTFSVEKNKLGPPYRKAQIPLIYGVGYDLRREVLTISEGLGLVEKSGSWYNYGDKKAQGEDNFLNLLLEDEALYMELRNKAIELTGLSEFYE